ncbi:STAS domain-containing protein [Aquabacterium sp. A7-Y]|uniref:STAS domain-containing protein n=1 Tax=Aquabacterium sp. A7-Y TaxID=1349605 RepID=UPI00223CE911|nr:STAS domain-containing protein [Aquabacterium sp. A7-Y]MCW7539045.1 STAS domain-containing protein [Aquabacterium sp. A7-Y]
MLLLPTTLTEREAKDTLRLLQQGLRSQPGDTVLIDAAGLKHFDSSALAVLLECQRLATAGGKRCQVRHLPPQLQKLASLYGIAELMPVPAVGLTPADAV